MAAEDWSSEPAVAAKSVAATLTSALATVVYALATVAYAWVTAENAWATVGALGNVGTSAFVGEEETVDALGTVVDASGIVVDALGIGASATADASETGAACSSVAHALETVVNATVTVAYGEATVSMDAKEIETYDVEGTVENAVVTASVKSDDATATAALKNVVEIANVAIAHVTVTLLGELRVFLAFEVLAA